MTRLICQLEIVPPRIPAIRQRLSDAGHAELFAYAAYLINKGHPVEEVVRELTIRSDYNEKIARPPPRVTPPARPPPPTLWVGVGSRSPRKEPPNPQGHRTMVAQNPVGVECKSSEL
ncbi:MAG: hypothetical protein QW580_05735 [Nitrososphaerota archaeon]